MLSALVATILAMPQPEIVRGEWLTDFEKAKRYASALNRPIIVNFTGSDWCPYCLRLRREVFTTDMFLDWAEENAVLVEADFPRKKKLPPEVVKQNEQLASEYAVGGYPFVLFLNGKGEVLGQSGYLRTPGPKYWTEHAEAQIRQGKERLASAPTFPEIQNKRLPMRDMRNEEFPTWDLGTPVNGPLPDLKGKTVLIDFWATWCSPCIEVMPKLMRWSEELGDDFVVIGVTDEPADKVKRFVSRHGITYPIVTDETHKIQELVGLQSLPAMVLVSSDGVVRWQGSSGDGDPLTSMQIKRMIEATK